MNVESIYLDGTYFSNNPDWDRSDAPWKAKNVASILNDNDIVPLSICEVGCGAGDILVFLQNIMPSTHMTGFDISPQLVVFWNEHKTKYNITFNLCDINSSINPRYDVLLMLDVFEHIRDPYSFLENVRPNAEFFVFHIPLELSVSTILRKDLLVTSRKKVGHLHYYTKELAMDIIINSGYEIINWRYTGSSLKSPKRSIKTRLASIVRRLFYCINKDLGVRLVGGETLLVLARPSIK